MHSLITNDVRSLVLGILLQQGRSGMRIKDTYPLLPQNRKAALLTCSD